MHALVDGDVLVYHAAFAAQKALYFYTAPEGVIQFDCMDDFKQYAKKHGIDVKEAKFTSKLVKQVHVFPRSEAAVILRNLLLDILQNSKCKSYTIFLSGKENFRDKVAVTRGYKATRQDAERPVHYEYVRSLLTSKYNAVTTEGQEADDAIGIAASEDNTVIASIDKDLNGIPGRHYDWKNKLRYRVSESDAIYFFCLQCLMGDGVDNIPGIPGMGEKKATGLLSPHRDNPAKLWEIVKEEYARGPFVFKNGLSVPINHDYLTEQAQLLWIRRQSEETWTKEHFQDTYLKEWMDGN